MTEQPSVDSSPVKTDASADLKPVEDVSLESSDLPAAESQCNSAVLNGNPQENSGDSVNDETALDSSNPPAVNDFDAEDEDEENGDDVVNVIIKPSGKGGIYKTGATYQARSVSHSTQHSKASRQGVELDDPGDIHGVPTIEFNLSSLGEEDKPWKRPGADITDYFNYGFTEETWVQYCEKQKILRQEYANATLKPVLSGGGTGLLQRLRTGGSTMSSRSFDSIKQASINVINLSNALNARALSTGINQNSTSETATALLNSMAVNSGGLISSFTQPPPGYPSAVAQADGSGAFATPLSGLTSLGASGTQQLLTGPNVAGASGMFPNMSLPPPLLNALSNWPAPVGVHGLLAGGDAVIDPATGQISALMDHSNRSPESIYDSHGSRRKSRHYHGEEENYLDRVSYRSRRRSRSRSGSRDRHSRHHRRRDSGHSERDYDRRSGRRSHRSRDDRFSAGPSDEMMDMDGFCPPTSAIIHSDRRGDRDRISRDRSERNTSREKSNHRSHRRDSDRSSKSSRPSRRRSRSRSSHLRDLDTLSKSPLHTSDSGSKTTDPLVAAAAAAANIAIALGASTKTTP